MKKLRCLELFAGVGGQALALRRSGCVRSVGYCEIDPVARQVLQSNMGRAGGLDKAPVFEDVKEIKPRDLAHLKVDMIAGGFPCQDLSVAGKRRGLILGDRSSLLFTVLRLVKASRPKVVFFENVPPILKDPAFPSVLRLLSSLGYDCFYEVLSAGQVGARHLRKRWFMLCVRRKDREAILSQYRPAGDASLAQLFRQPVKQKTMPRNRPNMKLAKHYSKFMGNAVVPASALHAFQRLWEAASRASPADGERFRAADISRQRSGPVQFTSVGGLRTLAAPELPPHSCGGPGFVVSPPSGVRGGRNVLPLLRREVASQCAPTPRTGTNSVVAFPTLTSRTIRDLGGFLLRSREFLDKGGRASPIREVVAPEYLCAFMGFPRDWLKALPKLVGAAVK